MANIRPSSIRTNTRWNSSKLAKLLDEAAAATDNASLKKFLTLRAKAFLDNDYLPSDFAWMDLDSPVDITIGPYETYNDELFGYKAAFEAYVNIRDQTETQKLNFFAKHMQELEDNLPLDAQYRNPKVGALAPMVVVNQVYGAGDGNMGVQTAAYNLPNDERIISARGSKRVMLKNVQEAKFKSTLTPISKLVLTPEAQQDVDFDSFFTHILAHEITHGLGPHATTIDGKPSTPRQDLKEAYSTIEEAKADITGLCALALHDGQGPAEGHAGAGRGGRAQAVQHLPRLGLPHPAFRPDRFARARHGHPDELHPRQGRLCVAWAMARSASISARSSRP